MQVEAFTQSKDPGAPEANEDRYVLSSGRYYAVVDGVTDKSGRALPDGSSRGQEAGRLIAAVLADLDAAGALFETPLREVVQRFDDAFASRYVELGESEEALRDPNLRFGAQLALAVPGSGQRAGLWRLAVIGDSAIRVGGERVLGATRPAEALLARWRAIVVEAVLEVCAPANLALACGREYCLGGTEEFLPEWAGVLPLETWRAAREAAFAAAERLEPGLSAGAVREVLAGGVRGAARFRNRGGELGTTCIDGFTTLGHDVVEEVVTLSGAYPTALPSLELFTDGYFGTPAPGATRLADWEAHIAEVERVDPLKVWRYPATKGSGPGAFTDDRTVVTVNARPRGPLDRAEAPPTGRTEAPHGGSEVAA